MYDHANLFALAPPVQAGRRKSRSMPSGVAGVVVFALFAAVVFLGGRFAWGVRGASARVL